jgi:hypothetical protein
MIETNAPREIHVDIKSEYQKAVTTANATTANATNANSANTAATAATTTTEPEESNVFVKLKSYNNATNLKIHTNTNDKTTDKNDGFVTSDSKTTTPSNKILRENANRYSYRGKIDDFAEHHASFLAERRRTASAAASAQTDAPTVGGYAEFKKNRSAL